MIHCSVFSALATPWSHRARLAAFVGVCCLLAACAAAPSGPPAPVAELAPTGKLRAAINFGNPILAVKDAASGEARGVSVDLALELGRRLGVPVELVTFNAAGKVVEAVKAAQVDIAFVAIDPVRGADMLQTPPYVIIEGAYLVRSESPIQTYADVDRAGNRIAIGKWQRLRPLSDPGSKGRHAPARANLAHSRRLLSGAKPRRRGRR